VAGVAALMLSKNPNLTPDEVEAKLKSTARAFPATCTGCGSGIVDAAAAVNAAIGTTVTTPPASTPPVETESNDTLASANAVATSGTVLGGTIGSLADTDYFVVQVPAGRTLTATLTPGSGTADYDLYVYNSAGTTLASSQNGAGSVDSVGSLNNTTATAARYVRVLYFGGGTGATNGKYTLKLSW
jgi:serine protease